MAHLEPSTVKASKAEEHADGDMVVLDRSDRRTRMVMMIYFAQVTHGRLTKTTIIGLRMLLTLFNDVLGRGSLMLLRICLACGD